MIYQNFNEVSDRFDTLLVDAYGVFWGGQANIPGSLETMASQVQAGRQLCILSNTSLRRDKTIELYTRRGLTFGVHYTDVVTSGDVFFDFLRNDRLPWPGHQMYHFGYLGWAFDPNSSFRWVKDPKTADIVFIGVPQLMRLEWSAHPEWHSICRPADEQETRFDVMTSAPFKDEIKRLVDMDLPAISTNPDLIVREGNNWLIRQGTIAELYRHFGGRIVEFGKPYTNIYEYAFHKLGITPSEKVAMIGDTFRTDIRGALDNGITPVWCIDTGVAKYELDRGISLEEQAGGPLDKIVLIRHL